MNMPDREKVIRGLEVCSTVQDLAPCPNECPYHKPDAVCYGTARLMQDALALLKEQETEYTPDGPDFTDGRIYTRWKCTRCQYFVCIEKGTPDIKYCPKCGRKVKWDV